MAKQSEHQKQWAKIVAKAWADEDYKHRLLADPATVIKEEGMGIPQNVELKCVENTESEAYIILPPRPKENIVDVEERLSAKNMCYLISDSGSCSWG